MRLWNIWDSYWGRLVSGSVGLFIMLPLITSAFGGGYTLGVYIGTGIAVLWYTVETYYLRRETALGVRNAWKANQAGLLKQMLEEHAGSAKDREVIQEWWRKDPSTAIRRYEEGLLRLTMAPVMGPPTTELIQMHESRRRASQYFLRLRALCEEGMLHPNLVAKTLGGEAVQVFLLYIDPLDQTVRRVDGKKPNFTEREYFQGYVTRFFSEIADQDPWGLLPKRGA